ncbi:MAG: hypothetical protein H6819_09890 [Phycisphaerales bacterium]|nr:hypothetical protein [Phycisphaerales bacterium]MCB9857959.1 hypothetical protein [Phycisphaerales bacterium]MCB9864948.1 hypothetical protein [Phycisphaerales bacterium]
MSESPYVEFGAIPCPECEYDLRGQSTPCCPECGLAFDSLEAMMLASKRTNQVLRRVQRWRRPLDVLTLLSLSAVVYCYLTDTFGRLPPIVAISIVLLCPICGLLALILLIQVLRWRRNPLVPKRHRERLNESVYWLIILISPLAIIVFAIVLANF